MEWNPYDKNCPTRRVLDRVADKWSVLILVLLQRGPVRFNALRRAIQGISQKVLSQTLKELERDGLIHREVFPTVPVTVEYSITPLGKTLAEVVRGLTVWAEENMSVILQAQHRYDEHLAP